MVNLFCYFRRRGFAVTIQPHWPKPKIKSAFFPCEVSHFILQSSTPPSNGKLPAGGWKRNHKRVMTERGGKVCLQWRHSGNTSAHPLPLCALPSMCPGQERLNQTCGWEKKMQTVFHGVFHHGGLFLPMYGIASVDAPAGTEWSSYEFGVAITSLLQYFNRDLHNNGFRSCCSAAWKKPNKWRLWLFILFKYTSC